MAAAMSTCSSVPPAAEPLAACVSCQAVFPLSAQRSHYAADWHRYNLKRRVAGLPPVELRLFEEKAAERVERENEERRRSAAADVPANCAVCGKKFRSAETFAQHCLSKKHKENEKRAESRPKSAAKPLERTPRLSAADAAGDSAPPPDNAKAEDDDGEDDDDDNWSDASTDGDDDDDDGPMWDGDPADAVHIEQCLFCGAASADSETNLRHMYASHGFFVPDVQFCTDVDGLLRYLGEKVGCGRYCVHCAPVRKRRYADVGSVRRHMRDAAHCTLRRDAESMLELAEFYDYSASYPDAGEADADSEAPVADVMLERNWQLVLPSGAALGHRSLARYFRQRLRPDAGERRARAVQRAGKVNAILAQYRAIGWGETSVSRELALRTAKDSAFMRRALARRQHMIDGPRGNKQFVFTGRAG